MPKIIKLLPDVDILRQQFFYHEETFEKCGSTFTGGIRLRNPRHAKEAGPLGSPCGAGYLRTTVKTGKGLFMVSRIVYSLHFGNLQTFELIDHVNGDVSDNRISNLRKSDNSQNQMNRFSSRAGAKSKYLGVCCTGRKIRAVYSENGAPIDIGLFRTEREAAIARDEIVFAKHGSRARLNRDLFPEDFS